MSLVILETLVDCQRLSKVTVSFIVNWGKHVSSVPVSGDGAADIVKSRQLSFVSDNHQFSARFIGIPDLQESSV